MNTNDPTIQRWLDQNIAEASVVYALGYLLEMNMPEDAARSVVTWYRNPTVLQGEAMAKMLPQLSEILLHASFSTSRLNYVHQASLAIALMECSRAAEDQKWVDYHYAVASVVLARLAPMAKNTRLLAQVIDYLCSYHVLPAKLLRTPFRVLAFALCAELTASVAKQVLGDVRSEFDISEVLADRCQHRRLFLLEHTVSSVLSHQSLIDELDDKNGVISQLCGILLKYSHVEGTG